MLMSENVSELVGKILVEGYIPSIEKLKNWFKKDFFEKIEEAYYKKPYTFSKSLDELIDYLARSKTQDEKTIKKIKLQNQPIIITLQNLIHTNIKEDYEYAYELVHVRNEAGIFKDFFKKPLFEKLINFMNKPDSNIQAWSKNEFMKLLKHRDEPLDERLKNEITKYLFETKNKLEAELKHAEDELLAQDINLLIQKYDSLISQEELTVNDLIGVDIKRMSLVMKKLIKNGIENVINESINTNLETPLHKSDNNYISVINNELLLNTAKIYEKTNKNNNLKESALKEKVYGFLKFYQVMSNFEKKEIEYMYKDMKHPSPKDTAEKIITAFLPLLKEVPKFKNEEGKSIIWDENANPLDLLKYENEIQNNYNEAIKVLSGAKETKNWFKVLKDQYSKTLNIETVIDILGIPKDPYVLIYEFYRKGPITKFGEYTLKKYIENTYNVNEAAFEKSIEWVKSLEKNIGEKMNEIGDFQKFKIELEKILDKFEMPSEEIFIETFQKCVKENEEDYFKEIINKVLLQLGHENIEEIKKVYWADISENIENAAKEIAEKIAEKYIIEKPKRIIELYEEWSQKKEILNELNGNFLEKIDGMYTKTDFKKIGEYLITHVYKGDKEKTKEITLVDSRIANLRSKYNLYKKALTDESDLQKYKKDIIDSITQEKIKEKFENLFENLDQNKEIIKKEIENLKNNILEEEFKNIKDKIIKLTDEYYKKIISENLPGDISNLKIETLEILESCLKTFFNPLQENRDIIVKEFLKQNPDINILEIYKTSFFKDIKPKIEDYFKAHAYENDFYKRGSIKENIKKEFYSKYEINNILNKMDEMRSLYKDKREYSEEYLNQKINEIKSILNKDLLSNFKIEYKKTVVGKLIDKWFESKLQNIFIDKKKKQIINELANFQTKKEIINERVWEISPYLKALKNYNEICQKYNTLYQRIKNMISEEIQEQYQLNDPKYSKHMPYFWYLPYLEDNAIKDVEILQIKRTLKSILNGLSYTFIKDELCKIGYTNFINTCEEHTKQHNNEEKLNYLLFFSNFKIYNKDLIEALENESIYTLSDEHQDNALQKEIIDKATKYLKSVKLWDIIDFQYPQEAEQVIDYIIETKTGSWRPTYFEFDIEEYLNEIDKLMKNPQTVVEMEIETIKNELESKDIEINKYLDDVSKSVEARIDMIKDAFGHFKNRLASAYQKLENKSNELIYKASRIFNFEVPKETKNTAYYALLEGLIQVGQKARDETLKDLRIAYQEAVKNA